MEWFATLVMGFLPMIGKLLMEFVLGPANSGEQVVSTSRQPVDWAPEFLFAGIAVSGACIVGGYAKLSKGVFDGIKLSSSLTLGIAVVLLGLAACGMVYGAVASGHALPVTAGLAVALWVFATAGAFVIDMSLANTEVQAKLRQEVINLEAALETARARHPGNSVGGTTP